MFDPRSGAKKVAAPVTARMDRYLAAMIEQVHAAKVEILEEMAAAEARQSERHFVLGSRLTAIEAQLKALNSSSER